jgi:hypothetical protein
VRKLLLLVVLGIVVTYYFPDSRTWLTDISRPLWVPVVKWNTEEEMRQVARDVVAHEALTGKLPDRRAWLDWLDYRYSLDEMKSDAWGSVYQLKVWADSIAVWSYGPDRTRNTEDDFQVAAPRQRHRR